MCVRTIATAALLLLASCTIWAQPAANPDRVGGKTLDEWLKDFAHKDPSMRADRDPRRG